MFISVGKFTECIVIPHSITAQSNDHSPAPDRGQGREEAVLQPRLDEIGLSYSR